MKVVSVNDFDIPSDENDYDELLAFADTMASIEQFEAIPKVEYEARLRADIIAVLEKRKSEIDDMPKYYPYVDHTRWYIDGDVFGLIQQKIDALNSETEV